MNKIKLIFLSLIIIFMTISVIPAKEAVKETVSILYFDNTTKNKEYDWLSKGIADMLISDIGGTGFVDVAERANLKKIIDEQELSMTGLVDDTKAVEVGKLLSATKLIYGSYIIQGNTIIINGKLTDTETGKIISTFSVQGQIENVLLIQNELSFKTQKALGFKVDIVTKPKQQYAVEAIKNYYQGLDLLDKGAVEDARKKFEQASRIDPYYLKPYQGIEESYKFLKDFIKMRQQREIASLYDKINRIQTRLRETPWRTFADIAMNPYYQKMKLENKALYDKETYAYFQGETPAVCTWNLQHNLMELAGLYENNFQDTEKANSLHKEIISITEKSRKLFKKDPFLPEILYSAVLAVNHLEDWNSLKQRCEELMSEYPDYRMMWAIEDFYKKSLEKLSKK